MVIGNSIEPFQIRVPTVVSESKDIQLYDVDNKYPQRCEEAVKRSYTLQATVNSVADFLSGEGFADPAIASLVVNDAGLMGETLNKVLRKTCSTHSKWKTVCLHIGYDLNFRISSINWIPFEFIRFPIAEADGTFDYVWYCTNWEGSRLKGRGQPVIKAYRLFNPDPACVAEQIEEAGGNIEDYNGQILFLTPEHYQYPVAAFDPVLDHAQTQNELGMFKLGYTQNGMMATLVVLYRGEFEDANEKKEFKDLVKRKKGARNANSVIGVQDKSGTLKVGDMFQSLQPANLDRLFELTEQMAVNAILENEGWPKILIGVQAQGTLFNQESMVDAYTYANAKTRNRRAEISEIFSFILAHWAKPILSDARITEKVYGATGTTTQATATNVSNTTAQSAATPATSLTDGVLDSPRINSVLTNLTGRQSQGLDRILSKFNSGKYSEGFARKMLRLSVGLSDQDLDEIFEELKSSKEL